MVVRKLLSLLSVIATVVTLSACAPSNSDSKAKAPIAKSEKTETTQAPVLATDCKKLPELAPTATEIAVEDIKTNTYSRYHLVEAQVHSQTDFVPEKVTLRAMVSLKVSVNASVETPDILSKVDCKFMDGAPDGELNGDISAPMLISTEAGIMSGNVLVKYKIYGKNAQIPDELKSYGSKESKYSTLLGLKTALNEVGDAHLYRISDSQIELRASQTKTNGKVSYLVSTRQVFEAVR